MMSGYSASHPMPREQYARCRGLQGQTIRRCHEVNFGAGAGGLQGGVATLFAADLAHQSAFDNDEPRL